MLTLSITINYDGYVNSLSTRGFNLVLGIEILTIDHFQYFFGFLGHPVEIDHSSIRQTFEIGKFINTAHIYKTLGVEQIVFFLQAQYKYHKFAADLRCLSYKFYITNVQTDSQC